MLITELQNEDGTYIGTTIDIQVKPYISFIEKKLLCLNVLENCMGSDDNSMVICDYFLCKLVRDINIVKQYSNVDISDDNYISEYDFLVENKVFDFIINGIDPSELNFIDLMIEREADQRMKVCNSVEGILANRLDKIISKIPSEKEITKIIKEIPKAMNKIKPENAEIFKSLIQKQGGIN